jgi:hypothetical protein
MIIKRKRTEIDSNGFKSGNSKSEEHKGPGFYKRSDSSSFVSNHVYNGKKAEHIKDNIEKDIDSMFNKDIFDI